MHFPVRIPWIRDWNKLQASEVSSISGPHDALKEFYGSIALMLCCRFMPGHRSLRSRCRDFSSSAHPNHAYHLLKDLHPLLNRLESLLPRLTSGIPKHHLRFQTPRRWDAVFGLEAGVDRWVVMLEIDAHALCLEGGPDDVLHHAAGVLRP